MEQRLTIYDFAKIMNAPNDLNVWDISRVKSENQPDIEIVHFKWEWQGYSGDGDIFLKNGVIDYDDQQCRESVLNISSESKKQATKHYSPLYNEKNLLTLFEYVIARFL